MKTPQTASSIPVCDGFTWYPSRFKNPSRETIIGNVGKQKASCMQQLLSNASRKKAANAEALEQAERTHHMHFDRIHQQMLAKAARDAAAQQTEAERERRLSAGVEAPPKGYYELIEALNRLGNGHRANAEADLEREFRMNQQHFDVVMDNLVRSVARRRALQAMNIEQYTRVARDIFQYRVLEELRAKVARARARAACEAEQQAQQTCIGRVWDHRATSAMGECLDEIERIGSRSLAKEASARGRAEQIHEQRYVDVCEELRRTVACAQVDAAARIEQEQRIAMDRFSAALSDINRIGVLWQVYSLADQEQVRRMHEPPPSNEQIRAKAMVNTALRSAISVV